MSDSEEVESEEEFDPQLEFLDLYDPKRARKTHAIACANCTLGLEAVKYIECTECRATICVPCFQLGCEMGDHERDHAYRIVHGLTSKKLNGHWHDMDMTSVVHAAQKHKLGNWNEYLEDDVNQDKSRAAVCSFFDQFFVRGVIGQFALTEGFWMRDRHKYKSQGTLQKLLNEETHTNPLIYSMYIAAMRWKKSVKWMPNDQNLEQNVREACKEYINYKFDIEGRELLGTLHDDYFFGGDLTLPKPVLINPEFQELEEADSQILRESDRHVVELYEKEQERKRLQKESIRQRLLAGEVISLDLAPCLPPLLFEPEPEPSCSNQEEIEEIIIDEPSPSRINSKRTSRASVNEKPEEAPQPPSEPAKSSGQSPLKIVLRKGERGNYIVALNTLQAEINKEGSLKMRLTRRALEFNDPLSPQGDETKEDDKEKTPPETNGYHTPEQNGINGVNGVDHSDIEDNELFTDDNSVVDADDASRLEQDTQLEDEEAEQETAKQAALEEERRAEAESSRPKRGRPRKKVTYVEEDDEEDNIPSRRGRRPSRKSNNSSNGDTDGPYKVQLRARRNTKSIVDDEDEDEPPVESRRSRRKNKHIDEGEDENQPDEPRSRRSSRLFIKIPDAEEQDEQEEEDQEEEVADDRKGRTLKNVIGHKKQKRKKKSKIQKSKKLRRIEAFQKRESKKAKKLEKAVQKYSDIITLDQIRELRDRCSQLQLFCEEERRRPPPKFRPDDIAMLTFNPNRNEYECESINDAEKMVGNLQLGPLTAIHEITDLEQEVKFARLDRYNRALHVRNARKNAINEHDKIFEFIDYIKYMVSDPSNTNATYDTRTRMEKLYHRTQQTLNRDEYNLLVQRWEKFSDLKYKIEKLQELQRQGATSLKGVDLVRRNKARPKKTTEHVKKAESRYKSFQKNHLRMYAQPDE